MNARSVTVAAASLVALAACLYAAEVQLKDIKCVMNPKGAATAENAVEYKGGKVFFCCENCPEAFKTKVKDTPLVAAKANAQLVATKQARQAACPFSGEATKDGTEVKVNMASIQFCCENCQGKAKKLEGDEQILALFSDEAFKKAGFKVEKAE